MFNSTSIRPPHRKIPREIKKISIQRGAIRNLHTPHPVLGAFALICGKKYAAAWHLHPSVNLRDFECRWTAEFEIPANQAARGQAELLDKYHDTRRISRMDSVAEPGTQVQTAGNLGRDRIALRPFLNESDSASVHASVLHPPYHAVLRMRAPQQAHLQEPNSRRQIVPIQTEDLLAARMARTETGTQLDQTTLATELREERNGETRLIRADSISPTMDVYLDQKWHFDSLREPLEIEMNRLERGVPGRQDERPDRLEDVSVAER